MARILLKRALNYLSKKVFNIEYKIEAYAEYMLHVLAGGNFRRRISYYPGQSFGLSARSCQQRLALFAAYHPGCDRIPESNKRYLEALLSCGFRIIYIHNGPLQQSVFDELAEYCERVLCRQNIGQDFGAWKDSFAYAKEEFLLEGVEWLLMCNDSNFYLAGDQGKKFVNSFSAELDASDYDLIALTKNYELWQHYQSFFLCFRKSLFTRASFVDFWQTYRPIGNRYHVIQHGEIALTKKILVDIRAKILYQSYGLLDFKEKMAHNPQEFFSLLPQNALYLAPWPAGDGAIDELQLQRILALLDQYNTIHVYALLFVFYLSSPFLKKDLVSKGIFSMPQVCSLLASIGLGDRDATLYREIVSNYEIMGTNTSYIRYARQAFRKGIVPWGVSYKGHGNFIKGLGLPGVK